MPAIDRQVRIQGTTDWCKHTTENVESYSGKVIARRCKLCGVIWGLAHCKGCNKEKFCELVSADGKERYCTVECQNHLKAARAKGKEAPKGGWQNRGRK